MKTIVIVGAGKGLGYSIAQCFGKQGYRVGLVARTRAKLDRLVEGLAGEGIEADAFAGDVTDSGSLEQALRDAEERFGRIDVLEFSPIPGAVIHVLDATREHFQYHLDYAVLAAVTATCAVLPGMRRRGEGAFVFTMGGSCVASVPSHGAVGAAQAAMRSYALVLSEALRGEGIYSGSIAISNIITPGGEADPDRIAMTCWEMVTKRDRNDVMIGDPKIGAALERAKGKISADDLERAIVQLNTMAPS